MSDPTPNQTTAVARRQETHVDALSRYLKPRAAALASYARGRVDPDTLIRLACYESSKADWMRKCTPESVYASLIVSAQLGLEPSGVRGEAYLVPFKGQCSLIPGYRGLIKLALRSGKVKSIRARAVYRGDEFVVQLGSEESIHHRPLMGREGVEMPPIIGAYAIAVMDSGEHMFDVMDGWELDKHRNASQQKNGPAWSQWPEEMYRKCPVRRLAKYLPLGDEAIKAIKIDELHEAGKADEIGDFIDIPSETTEQPAEPATGSRIANAVDKAKP